MLRDWKPGAQVLVLDTKKKTIGEAVIVNTAPIINYANPMMPPTHMNLSFKYDGRDITFGNCNANAISADDTTSGLMLCESNEALIGATKAFRMSEENEFNRHEEHAENMKWCDEILEQRDPVKQAQAQGAMQVEAIKKEFGDIIARQNEKIDQLTALLQQSLSGKKGKE